jgi:hypothetical protein
MDDTTREGIDALDRWLRSEFVDINTRLERAYAAADVDGAIDGAARALQRALRRDGTTRIGRIAAHGELPTTSRERYALLGRVGYFLAACRRHEIDDEPTAAAAGDLSPAWSIAGRLAAALGVAPRWVFAHQALYNPAHGGVYQTFTDLVDERVFLEANARGVRGYRRAAFALREVADLGMSNPLAAELLDETLRALGDVVATNRTLAAELDVQRFFRHVRPYFQPFRVGDAVYRGVNAGDFAAIHELDVGLGLCRMDDPLYRAVVLEKQPYVPPEDQARLRALVDQPSLLALALAEARASPSAPLADNVRRLLRICAAHGAGAAFHYHRLVLPFIVQPTRAAATTVHAGAASGGPPLEVVLAGLARLVDLRTARHRAELPSAHGELAELRRFASSHAGAAAGATAIAAVPPRAATHPG